MPGPVSNAPNPPSAKGDPLPPLNAGAPGRLAFPPYAVNPSALAPPPPPPPPATTNTPTPPSTALAPPPPLENALLEFAPPRPTLTVREDCESSAREILKQAPRPPLVAVAPKEPLPPSPPRTERTTRHELGRHEYEDPGTSEPIFMGKPAVTDGVGERVEDGVCEVVREPVDEGVFVRVSERVGVSVTEGVCEGVPVAVCDGVCV